MPFPPKQTPPPLKTPGEKYEIEEPETPEVEAPEAAPTGLDAIGEEFGLDPTTTRQFVKRFMRHLMSQFGGDEPEEGESEEYPE
jgi:phage terminase small subunit